MSKLNIASKPPLAIDKAAIAQHRSVDQAIKNALADADKPTAEQSAAESAVDLRLDIGHAAGSLRAGLVDLTAERTAEAKDLAIDVGRPSVEDLLAASGPDAGGSSGGGQSGQEEAPRNPLAGMFEDTSTTFHFHDDVVVVTDIDTDAGTQTMTFIFDDKVLTASPDPWPPIEPVGTSGEDASGDDASGDKTSGDEASGDDTSGGETDGGESSGGGVIDAIIDFFSDLFSGNDDSAEGSQDSGADANSGAASTPDEDYISPEERMALAKSLGLDQIYRPSHDNDEIKPADDGGVPAVSETEAPLPDLKNLLLGGDTVDPDLEHAGGHAGEIPAAGDIDYGPDHDETPQTSGPEEHDTRQTLEPGATEPQQTESATDTGDRAGTLLAHRDGAELLERVEQRGTLEQFEAAKLDKSLLDLVRVTLTPGPLDGMVVSEIGGAPSSEVGPIPMASANDLPGPTLVHDQAQLFL